MARLFKTGCFGYALILAAALFSCGRAALEAPPIITSATYQHTLYNGKPQPVEARAAREGTAPFVVTYFPSEEALLGNEGGTPEAPGAVGVYYARIERPAGNGFAAGPDIKVEYHIQKALVAIRAEEKQEAFYDGKPKEARAAAEPPLPLDFAYYRGTAFDPAAALSGPPVEAGLYSVLVSFAGDANHLASSRTIELSIVRR
ncbi:MAG: hypothetical protein LBJ90_08875 [Treponema sp.]|jgi:hypothetical protein|nr:hypothetical protein [Treponema sp.]